MKRFIIYDHTENLYLRHEDDGEVKWVAEIHQATRYKDFQLAEARAIDLTAGNMMLMLEIKTIYF